MMNEARHNEAMERAVDEMPVTAGKAFAVMVFEMAPGGGVHHGGMFKRGGWAIAGDQVKRVEEPGVSAKLALALVERVVKWELGAVGAMVSGVAEDAETRRGGDGERVSVGDAGHPSVQSAGEGMAAGATGGVDDVAGGEMGEGPRGGLPAAQSDDGATPAGRDIAETLGRGERCDGGDQRWGIHISGMDEYLACENASDAERRAREFNAWMAAQPRDVNTPHCEATAKVWPFDEVSWQRSIAESREHEAMEPRAEDAEGRGG